jgi:allantoicase
MKAEGDGGTAEFEALPDLASERLGGAVVAASDEFFAPKEALLRAHPPEWREGIYTDRGKWMDGWETRRHSRDHDWCIVRLGAPGIVRGVVVDTAFFRGNFPERCAVDLCALGGTPSAAALEAAEWREAIPPSPLLGDARNAFAVGDAARATHLRLRIYPDGGVARLRVHGEVVPEWTRFALDGGEVDLAALENGGRVEAASDTFYGGRQNLILPGRARNMGDGWETRRRRTPGSEWTVVRLARPGVLHRVEVDTDHFLGNAPERCAVQGVRLDPGAPLPRGDEGWEPILAPVPLEPHARHRFEELLPHRAMTHVRLSIFPDGGVARLRLFGTLPRENG